MTLNEYLSQKDPVRMPNVIVKKNEYVISSTCKFSNGKIRQSVYFKSKNQLLQSVEYLLIGNSFYTIDHDGNAKNRSCFSIM